MLSLRINNGLTTIALENVKVEVNFADKDKNPVLASSDPNNTEALFFIRIDTMENIASVDGSGTVAPSSSADIHWLIIPAPGASNGVSQGSLYYVGAKLTYTIGGKENVTDVTPDYIYVKPMPELTLDYFLPIDVYGDDAFTPEIEPPIPFPLGVRVRNTGTGVAKNLKIDSAQPKIVDNAQGLLVGFNIESTEVNGKLIPNTLLATFGDIAANTASIARWMMTCTLSGRFVEFKAEYSHSDELGGKLTSLIEGVNTHFLIRDVLVDVPGRDSLRDFLAKDGGVYRIYESDTVDTEVPDQSASSNLSFKSQAGIDITYTLSSPVTAGFMYVQLSDPNAGNKIIKSVVRSDGKQIKTENVWLSKKRAADNSWQYFINLFDANTTSSYIVVFTDPAGVNHPPVLQFIPDKTGSEGTQLSFLVQASDPDGTIPVLSASALPALAGFTDQGSGTGVFNWTPATGQAGRYEITFTASDGVLKTSQRVVVTITGTGNNPPLVPSSPSPQDGASSIPVNASLAWTGGDPDAGDPVTYDVYLGTSSPPGVKVSANQSAPSFTTSTLTYGTTHYWKIVARDSHGAETAGPVWRFTTLFASSNLVSTVATDRSTYNIDETVGITSNLRNANQTINLQNLVAKVSISNSLGTTLLTDEKQIQTILAGETITTNTSWNTAKNPKGTYTVKLEVFDGTTLASASTTSFQILGSSQTGEGLVGTLTPQPNLVYQGKDETLSYSLTNNGNEDVLNLTVRVLIVNPETQETKQTLESTASLVMGATSNGNFVAPTSDLTPGDYTATLQVSSASLTQAKTLATTTFKVIQAVTLPFSDDFESYTVQASPPVPWFELGDAKGIVTNMEFHSGQNAIAISGGPENSQSAFVGLGETYPDRIGYEAWVKVSSTGSSAYVGFSGEILGIMPQFNAVYFNGSDGKVYFISADKDHGFTVPLLDGFAIGVWHQVHVEIDFATLVGDVYIDDVLVGRDLPVSPKDAVWEQDGTHSFQLNKVGVTHVLGEAFYFDDFLVFEVPSEHTITATTGLGGTVTPSGSVVVEHEESQTFTITPDIGQHILDVKVDGTSVGTMATYTFTNVTSAHTIEATFAINQHTITAAAGSNGTITPSGSVTVDDGGSQTFTIMPNTGYRISDVEVDSVMLGVTKSYTFSNVTADHTISATFKQIQVISLPFTDNFEDDTVGAQPNVPWDNFNGGPAMVMGSGSHSPANSISVSSGPEGSGSAFVNLGETYSDRIAYEVWTRVNSTGSSAYVGFSEEILGIMPQFNAVYFNGTDGKVYFTSADRDHGFVVPILNNFTIGVWHKVRVQVDFANLIADVFIDDVRVGSGLPVSPKDAMVEQDGTHSFQLNKVGVTHALGEPFYFDDFLVSEWNPNTPLGLLRSAGPGQWAVLGMGGIGSAGSTSISMSGSSSIRGTVANTGVANAGNVNMSGSTLINGTLSLNTAGRLNKSGTSAVAGGVLQNTATDGVLDQAVADALAASQSAASLPATITSPTSVIISNPSQNITITGGTGTNVLHITNIAISNGTLTLSAPHGGSFIMNVSGSFALSGASRIVLAGGITPSNVLYNFVGSGGGVAMSGGAAVTGILLAPQKGIALSNGIVTGEIIAGGSGIAFSGTTQVNNPGP